MKPFVWQCVSLSHCSTVTALLSQNYPPVNELQIIDPGEEIPVGIKIKVVRSGTYLIAKGATSVTTRCFGTVTVSFDPVDGPTQSNTCQRDNGISSQTNLIQGVNELEISLELGSYAEVLLR